MIVLCPSCQAKFKLADEKVTAKGVKIRCSKCTAVFTVRPDGSAVIAGEAAPKPPVPSAPPATKAPPAAKPGPVAGKAGFDSFDLGEFAEVSTKSHVPKGPPPPAAPKPAPLPQKAAVPKPAAPKSPVDDDLSGFFSAGVDKPPPAAAPKPPVKRPPPPAAAANDPFASIPPAPPRKAKASPSPASGGDGLDDLFASAPPPQPKPSPAPPKRPAAPVARRPAVPPPPPPSGDGGENLDFGGDIELDVDRTGDAFGGVFADAPPPPKNKGGKAPGSDDSFDSLLSGAPAGFADAPPPPTQTANLELDAHSSKTLEFLSRAGDSGRRKPVRDDGPGMGLIIGLTVGVTVLLAVGLRSMVEFAPESLPGVSLETARLIRDIVPFPVTNPDFPPPQPKIEARVDQTFPVTNLAGEVIYVATGKMVNRSGAPMNFLRVRLRLRDPQGTVLQEKTVYAGNSISVDRLQKTDPQDLDSELQRKLGANNSNMNVGNNTTLNFMAIFYRYGGDPGAVEIVETTAGL